MIHAVYLLALLLSIAGLIMLDARLQLVWWANWRQALHASALGMVFFVAWDVAGIGLSIFVGGTSPYVTGLRIGQFPIEELFFLFLFIYSILLVGEGAKRWHSR